MDSKFYMVFVEDNRTPVYKHSTIGRAVREGKRLCEELNKTTYILEAVKKIELDKFLVTELIERPF